MAPPPAATSDTLLTPLGARAASRASRASRDQGALERLLLDLRADHPAEPGPAHLPHRTKFTEVLATLGQLAIAGDRIDELLASACALVAEALSVDGVALLVPAEAVDRMAVRVGAGVLAGATAEELACGPGTQAGFALEQLASTATADVHASWPGDAFLARHGLAASALAVLPGPAGPLGLLGAFEAGFRAFAPDELRFLEAAAAGLSAALLRHASGLERQWLYARLAVADRMVSLGTLTGGVAHELNNPLSYVTANLAFVAEEVAALAGRLAATGVDDAGLAESARQVLDAAADARDGVDKVRGLVRDLQTLSRGDDSALVPLDLTQVLESSINVAGSELKHRAVVRRALAAALPPVRANEARLGQVFLNLLVNAAHAIPAGRSGEQVVHVRSFAAPGQRVAVEVSDTGCGIPADQLEAIFEPFFSTKAPGEGAGLGLSVCRSIVEALGGTIEVESEVGVGSTFRVLLPVAPADPAEGGATPPAAVAQARRGRLLVVDDEPLVGTVIQRTLGGEFEIVAVGSGPAALKLLEAGERFDLILCDLLMPGMSGMALHAALARLSPALAGRMVFLSGGAFTPEAREFLAAPGRECIDKPFDLEAIRGAIGRHLRPPGPG
jgi:signal transduction histidine kinase